jgi:GT2 family glycosyltransferase
MKPITSTVLIASLHRPDRLSVCLKALITQSVPPDEVLVVWQGDDYETREVSKKLNGTSAIPIRTFHSPEVGIVPAENVGLRYAAGEVILFIDDDAVPEPHWVARHLAHYGDEKVGAVGASYTNFHLNGDQFPERRPKAFGKITWYGQLVGYMFDHPLDWRECQSISVQHLAAGNMSLRRSAFAGFNQGLKPYWQLFEADACLQVARNGYKVRFDFANPVKHYPTGNIFDGRRSGNLELKVLNLAYNHALILALHSPAHLYLPRILYLLLVGSRQTPGLVGFCFSVSRYGEIKRELRIMARTMAAHVKGWYAGTRARSRGLPEQAMSQEHVSSSN